MTDDLKKVLELRADRARSTDDPEQLVALIAARAESLAHRRRNRLAIAGGTGVAVAAAVVAVAIAGPGGSHESTPDPAGGVPSSSASTNGRTATELPAIGPLHGSAQRRHELNAAERQARLARQREQRRQQQARLTHLREQRRLREQDQHTTLVHVAAAPPTAEISIGLIPSSYVYLGHDTANTYYGPAGTTTDDAFSDGIVVDVHLTLPGAAFPDTIDGHPASYEHVKSGSSLRLKYTNRIDVGFQISSNAPISTSQAERIAATIDVRSTTHTTEG